MPLVNEELKFKAQAGEAFNQKQGFKANAQEANAFQQNQFSESSNQPNKGLLTLPPALMQIVP